MRNEKGFSWPEAITSLAVLLLISSVLLPMVQQIATSLEAKKRNYHATLVMSEAAKRYDSTEEKSGVMNIEGIDYFYELTTGGICILFEGIWEEERKCIHVP